MEKGFANIFALCLILIIAFVVKGIQETERNHIRETEDFQFKAALRNAADYGIYVAAEEVRIAKENGEELLPPNPLPYSPGSRINNQHDFGTINKSYSKFGTITVQTWGEQIKMHSYKVSYNIESESLKENVAKKIGKGKKDVFITSYYFFSVAQATSSVTGQKVYHRATAYIPIDDDTFNLHFMELPSGNYKFEK
ncbi:MAG: hypothetical protein K6G55_03270 [Selenomonadaceae bacterium]|nr:hypothetical protein [Selenomonadaceae bacterium]